MIPPQNSRIGIIFYLVCPGQNVKPLRLIMTKDGSEGRHLKYQDYCPLTIEAPDESKKHEITVAFNNVPLSFHVFNDTNTMKEFSLWWTLSESRQHPHVPLDWEILKVFFDTNNIEPTWIDCNYVWGLLDEQTGHWTGAVGKV